MKTPASPIPTPALLQHIGIVGKTGSGKTFTAKGIVEQLLDQERRVCILDPTGAWWGLKSSANGKDAGYPVVVFGGEHADVPISEHAGEALGKLIAEGNVPSVIDLSEMGEGERRRFAATFFEALYRHNKGPLHLIVDEADEFAPQSGAPGTEVMLGRIDRIVRRGRIKGFRVVMISQRPAVLNKNVFTQCETLLAMRLPSSQDRKAIELWIKGQGDESQAKEMMGSLASLKRGEGWVWAPAQGLLQRVHFPEIKTFDSSRTPEDGEQIAAPKRLADVDLSGISAAMAAAIEETKANDPVLLRKEIADLNRRVRDLLATPVRVDAGELGRAQEQISTLQIQLEEERREYRILANAVTGNGKAIRGLVNALENLVQGRGGIPPAPVVTQTHQPLADGSHRPAESYHGPTLPAVNGSTTKVRAGPRGHTPRAAEQPAPGGGNRASADGITAPMRRVLDAISWWESIGIGMPHRIGVAFVAGYTPTSGTWRSLLSQCVSAGLIAYETNGCLSLTAAGDCLATEPERVADTPALHARILEKLSTPQAKVFRVLAAGKSAPQEMARTQVAELAGYEATSGTFRTLLSSLSSIGLIDYPKRTTVAASTLAFVPF